MIDPLSVYRCFTIQYNEKCVKMITLKKQKTDGKRNPEEIILTVCNKR